MAKCGDCLHFQKCSHYVTPEETFPEVGGCSAFKNKDAFVEVVRCKDCKHLMHSAIYKQHFCTNIYGLRNICISNNDFCSYGERREGE